MKKNISINISGIIFHIEEDAFDILKDYLDGINRYFSTFTDSQEIIADIESRIAEIFLTKLHDEKQVITIEDVEALKATMGSIRDFQAVEDEFEESHYDYQQTSQGAGAYSSENKKLYRDEKRKMIAGVCAGIAHYFMIDPLWIRLLFVVATLASGFIFAIVYPIMWAVTPPSYDLPDNKNLKKMYRDPDQKVIAGVCSGIANYFATDVVVIRVVFVVTFLTLGIGLIPYILLWIILPEAKTVSDKVQMKGNPITLDNIESSIKQSLNVKGPEDENVLVKLLLLPFRLVAMLIEFLGKVLGPFFRLLVDFIRILIGAVMILVGAVTIISLIVAVGAFIGVFSTEMADISIFNIGHLGIPLDSMTNGVPGWTIFAGIVAAFIPLFFLILLGSSIIARRMTFSSNTAWTLFAAFVVSVIVLAINVPMIAFNFSEEGDYRVSTNYPLSKNTAVLKINETGHHEYNMVSLKIRGYSGSEYKLEQTFEAQGSSRYNAEQNAQMITYNVEQRDSLLIFDSHVDFKDDAVFRAQRLEMTLYIPYGAKFIMDRDMRNLLRNTLYPNGYRVSDLSGNTFTFDERGLVCLTCPEDRTREYSDDWRDEDQSDRTTSERWRSDRKMTDPGRYDKVMDLRAFDEIDIEGVFTINIIKGDKHQLLMRGRSRIIDRLDIDNNGRTLNISSMDFDHDIPRWNWDRDDIELTIITPDIRNIELTGASEAYLSDFTLRRLKVDLLGASSLKADINVEDLEVEITGASSMEIRGEGDELQADVVGASELDAYDFKVKNARLDADGVSSIRVWVTDMITKEESFISDIKNRGDARVRGDHDDW